MSVRREKVILELEDNFSGGMARSAASAKLLQEELKRLGTQAGSRGPLGTLDQDTQKLSVNLKKTTESVGILSSAFMTLGPALVPLGGAGLAAVSGLTQQFGFFAIGAGSAIIAMHGVGDALTAFNKMQANPTAANLANLQQKMSDLAPAAQKFVMTLASMEPQLKSLQQSSASALFPGVTEGLLSLQTRLPQVSKIISEASGALGELASEAGASLAGPEWDSWFKAVEQQAKPALMDLGHALGDVTLGLAQLWKAFIPLNTDFSHGMVDMAAKFKDWATNLDQTEGFQHFLDYIRTTGPDVLHLLGAVGNLFVQISRAAAPLGGPTLHILTNFVNVLANLASTPLGTITLSLLALSRAMKLLELGSAKLGESSLLGGMLGGAGAKTASRSAVSLRDDVNLLATGFATGAVNADRMSAATERVNAKIKEVAGKGAQLAAFGLVATGATDKIGLTNTATLALAGSMAGPWGAAAGAAVGGFLDIKTSADAATQSLKGADQAMRTGNYGAMQNSVNSLQAQIAGREKFLNDKTPFHLDNLGGLAKYGGGYFTSGFGLFGDTPGTQEAKEKKKVDELTAAMKRYAATHPVIAAALGLSGKAMVSWGQEALAMKDAVDKGNKSWQDLSSTITATNKQGKTTGFGTFLDQLTQRAKDYNQEIANAKIAISKGASADLIGQIYALGPAGAARMAQLAHATQTQMRIANNAVATFAKGAKSSLDKIPRQLLIHIQTTQAQAEAAALKRSLTDMFGNGLTIPVSISGPTGSKHPTAAQADGGTVGGQRHPYGDKVLTMLAPGEEVISNRHGQADQYRADRAAGRIPAYGNGGTVRRYAAGGTVTMSGNAGMWLRAHPDAYLAVQFDRLSAALTRSTNAVTAQTNALDAIKQQQDTLRSNTLGMFTGNPWQNSSVWMPGGGAGSVFSSLALDTSNAKSFSSLASRLGKRGLHGAALDAAETQGLDALRSLSGLSNADLKRYQSMFDARTRAAQGAASVAAGAYSSEINASTHHLATLVAQQRVTNTRLLKIEDAIKIQGNAYAKELNKAAAAGRRH